MVVKITMRRVRALDRSKVEITEAGPYGEFLFEERQIPHCISIALFGHHDRIEWSKKVGD
jgi:hypothetical protein